MEGASVADIVKKVRRIELVARRAVNDLFAGEYHSVFRGRGMEFDEVREYQPGDEIRTIDWNVTARAGAPFVKRYREERELTVLFLVDVSASGAYGSGDARRLDWMIQFAALLMFSALQNHDKVGLLTFASDVEQFFPPRKGKAPLLRLLRELVAARPRPRRTRLDAALDYLNRVQKRRAVVFLFSDFFADGYSKALAAAARRHDLIAVRVRDQGERMLEDVGFVTLEDLETGERRELDTRHPKVREWFAEQARRNEAQTSGLLRRAGVDELALTIGRSLDPDAVIDAFHSSLHRFFRMRERRR